MAQAQPDKEIHEKEIGGSSSDKRLDGTSGCYEGGGAGTFRFNAHAPEFVPRSYNGTTTTTNAAANAQIAAAAAVTTSANAQIPVSTGYFYPCFQYLDGTSGRWIYVADQDTSAIPLVANLNKNKNGISQQNKKDVLTEEIQQRIIKQVEYQFSDMSLLANENLAKHMNKDPEGFVPISVVASTKKLKSLDLSYQSMAQALRASSKLIVSNDGKKVKRKNPFTEKDKEDLQMRTVVAENLPDDHSHQNIQKIFSVVGNVKTIRICQPQDPNSSRQKSDFVSNKLHALIEYENPETAEKAAEKLNDERNWRKGLRVRLLLRRSPKSVLKTRKSDFDAYLEDDHDSPITPLQEESSQSNTISESIEGEDSSNGSKKWGRGRGKTRPRTQLHTARSLPASSSSLSGSSSILGEITSIKQTPKGPRMPDGTKGFTMGRGKPLINNPVRSNSVAV